MGKHDSLLAFSMRKSQLFRKELCTNPVVSFMIQCWHAEHLQTILVDK